MFRKHQGRRSTNPMFVIFRLILSLTMFILLLAGIYSAYKHFSGVDPLKLDPQAILSNLLKAKTPRQIVGALSSIGIKNLIPEKVTKIIPQSNVLGQSGKVSFKFLLVADSHNDNADLRKVINQAKQNYPDLQFIIGLGDYTDVGTLDELKKAKIEFDLSGLRYFMIAGDHDLWDSRDKQKDPSANFKEVFGPLYQSFTFQDYHFLLLDNSDNYLGLSEDQQSWINAELDKKEGNKGLFTFIHEPLYHPSSDHFMGRVDGKLKQQAKALLFQLKAAGVKKTFSGDTHYFSEYTEPETNVAMVTVGAVTIDRNPQIPRFSVVSVFDDGSTGVEDIQIK